MNALLLGSVDENLNYVIAIANILLLTIVTPLTASLATLWIGLAAGAGDVADLPSAGAVLLLACPAMRRRKCRRWGAQRLSGDMLNLLRG